VAEAHRLEKPQGQRSKRLGQAQAQIPAQAQVQVQAPVMSLQALRSSPQAEAKAPRLVLQGWSGPWQTME
jgi:hypothetical protein